jgi:predicted flap endonuclease-1-like 5' DNA nuclease/glycosidase
VWGCNLLYPHSALWMTCLFENLFGFTLSFGASWLVWRFELLVSAEPHAFLLTHNLVSCCMTLEFHLLRAARDRHRFDEALFTTTGRVVFADFAAARRFAATLNAVSPGRNARAGDINAMGLIDEVLHALLLEYRENHAPKLWTEALEALKTQYGERLDSTLEKFAQDFPPTAVYQNRQTLAQYMAVPQNKELLLEEMLLLWLENNNPAFAPYRDLFQDDNLAKQSAYRSVLSSLEAYLEAQPAFVAAGGISIFKALRLPAMQHPDSLELQLRSLMGRFGGVFQRRGLAGRFATLELKLRGGLDLFAEEARFFVAQNAREFGGAGAFEAQAQIRPVSKQMLEDEPEAFTLDQNWMPQVVLMAKNAFVWLDQLSKRYQRPIRTLAEIPDSELETLARWGVTGLWLIGLWERSHASKEIKHRMGNPDAVASAYSLWDYTIAHALGGDSALENLKARAWRYGIRMASDMVPNHTGIDSKWMAEHPDWFLQRDAAPYPSYRFGSENLSLDSRMQVRIEDHYYDRTDAAVTFLYTGQDGRTRHIYHGNDGTSLPWNDTAQLDYMNPAAREAVIQTIFRVARQFPIIRFDAAMTLAKRHIKRLWYPEPGSGEGIASRNEYGMSREQFDAMMPQEFWREVVDRAAFEVPDTLLLAEAFWMMEGYFVRTLGMHRVYNSAFMVMLRDERNKEYRDVIKNTLEFEPEILKRYVNFLSNPDEKTAVEQFGKADKYFGIMTLCATLPGLPMLGHGQIEGFTEKYGMEYQRAYYDETPDYGFMAHHDTQIFPLLKKRYLFAEVEHFALYEVDHDHVFAYSNRAGSERALVLYNNSSHHANVVIQNGLYAERQASLLEAMQLFAEANRFAIYRDNVSNLEYIRNLGTLQTQGFQIELGAYGRAVLLDWREVLDNDGRYARLAAMLGGRGVENLHTAVQELHLEKILTPWNELVNAKNARALLAPAPVLFGQLEAKAKALADGIEAHLGKELEGLMFAVGLRADMERLEPTNAETALAHLALATIKRTAILTETEPSQLCLEWLVQRQLERALRDVGAESPQRGAAQIVLLASVRTALEEASTPKAMLELLSADAAAPQAIGLNTFEGKRYVNAEAFVGFLMTAKAISSQVDLLSKTENAVIQNGYSLELPPTKKKASKAVSSEKSPAKKAVAKKVVAKKTPVKKATATKTKTKSVEVQPVAPATPSSKPKPPKTSKKLVPTPKITKSVGALRAAPLPTTPPKTKAPTKKDDLTRIEGIGPKIAAALETAGINTFLELSKTTSETLRAAIHTASIRLAPSLETWAQQAALLAKGDETGFQGLTDTLVAGRVVKTKAKSTSSQVANPPNAKPAIAKVDGAKPEKSVVKKPKQ